MKCTLIIGIKEDNFNFDKKKVDENVFRGRYQDTNLVLDSVKKAKQIAEIAGIDCFRVLEMDERYNNWNYSGEALYETADITAFNSKSKMSAEKFEKDQERRAKRINRLPKSTEIKGLHITGCKMFLTRSDYSYNKAYSRSLRGSVNIRIVTNNRTVAEHFTPTNYITRAGKFQIKKFKSDFYWITGVHLESMSEHYDYKALLTRLRTEEKKLSKQISEIK